MINKKKDSIATSNMKVAIRKNVDKEKIRFKDLSLCQYELRKKGIDIEIVGIARENYTERDYMGAIHYFDKDYKYVWHRVTMEPDSNKTYNNVLESCINCANKFLKENKAIIKRMELI